MKSRFRASKAGKIWAGKYNSYPFVYNETPGSSTERISNSKFDRIKQQVSCDIEQPNDPCPAPANFSDPCKLGGCSGRYQTCNLQRIRIQNSNLDYFFIHARVAFMFQVLIWVGKILYQLSNNEGNNKQKARSLSTWPAPGACHKN